MRTPGDAQQPLVTCVIRAGDDGNDAEPLEAICARVLAQDWRPIAVLCLGTEASLAGLPRQRGCSGLVHSDDDGIGAAGASDLTLLAGDFVLTAHGAAAPSLVRELVARLAAAPAVDEVAEGGWRLRRTVRRAAAPCPWPVLDVDEQTPVADEPETDGPFVLRFLTATPGGADVPYRWRRVLAATDCLAVTADAATADRLALLSPRTVRAPDDRGHDSAFARAMAARAAPRLHPWRPSPPRRIVLQADDFTEGGMEQVVIDLAEALQAAGFSARLLILGKEGSAGARARRRGLAVDRIAADPRSYAAYLDQWRPELVNAHYSTFGAGACAARGIPFVQTLHNTYVWFGPEHFDTWRAADRDTHAYVCVSNNVARYADLKMGLPAAHMVVIPNGCDHGYLASETGRAAAAALRDELGLPPTARVLLNVASIQPAKGQHLLLAALAAVAPDVPDAHLVIVGSAADEGYARAQQLAAERLGIGDRVHWVGRRDDVGAFHALADALVQPSFFEGWSLAITEAVLAGLPVIATDVGGAAEQLAGTDGILLPPAADVATLDRDLLMPLLAAPCTELQQRLADAMRAMLARGGARSRLPQGWRTLLRDCAYRRCAEAFHWFSAGGSPAGARRWLFATDADRGAA